MKRACWLALLLLASALRAPAIDPGRRCRIRCSSSVIRTLIHELRCLKCQGETVADTPAEFAVDIRRQVREMVGPARADDEVRQYLVDRYGEIILLRPRWSLANAWLWLAPALLLLGWGVRRCCAYLRQRRAAAGHGYHRTRRRGDRVHERFHRHCRAC